MAGAGAKLFASGDVLTAAQVNTYLMDQSVMRFADATARTNAFGGVGEPTLAEGMLSYLDSDNTVYVYDGSAWKAVGIGSTIDAKGDLLVGTANDTVGRQAVGANGTVLMADSAQTNGIAWSEQSLGYRNVVINGAMQVAQRTTSTASITGGGFYTADRWGTSITTLGTWTQTQENDAPTGSGFRKSFKILCTTADASPAAGDLMVVSQNIEGQNVQQFLKGTASAKQFALTFWVKSNVTGTYIVELRDVDNSRIISGSYTISASGTWEKKTIIAAADTTGAFDNDNNASLGLIFWLGAGSSYTSGTLNTTSWASSTNANRAVGQTNLAAATNNYWQVTGVQLEAGSVATPFEFEDYGITRAKCQRYYYKTYADGTATGTNTTVGMAFTGGSSDQYNNLVTSFPHGVQMRATPTLSVWTQTGTAGSWTYERSGVTANAAISNLYTDARQVSFFTPVGAGFANVVSYGHYELSAEL